MKLRQSLWKIMRNYLLSKYFETVGRHFCYSIRPSSGFWLFPYPPYSIPFFPFTWPSRYRELLYVEGMPVAFSAASTRPCKHYTCCYATCGGVCTCSIVESLFSSSSFSRTQKEGGLQLQRLWRRRVNFNHMLWAAFWSMAYKLSLTSSCAH